MSRLSLAFPGAIVAAVSFRGARWFGWGLGVATLLIAAGGSVVLGRALAWPEEASLPVPDPQAGIRVQGTVAQLLLREAGLSTRQDPLSLSAIEVNAFLSGHVQVKDPPVWPVRVEIGSDEVELGGATTLGRLVERGLAGWLARVLPGSVATYPVWVATRGRVAVTAGGRAEFVAHSGTIGRQRIPLPALWRVLGGHPPALVWRMPRIVDRVTVEPGRLLIYTHRPGSRRATPG
jgi:hypothetical protein